ncbi:hypothetical protein KF840_15985 [bacterium]|nr:hypothetical protein [bacterium]
MTAGEPPAHQLFVVVGRAAARLRLRLIPLRDGGERPAIANHGVGLAPLERLGDGDPHSLSEVFHLFRRLALADVDAAGADPLEVAFAAWGEVLARAGIDLRLERRALHGPPLPRSDYAAQPTGISLRPWDVELTALAAGLRTVVKLDSLPGGLVEPLRRTAEERGLRSELVAPPAGGAAESAVATLFVAREAEALRDVRSLEALLRRGGDDADTAAAVRRMGELLGYPRCCAARFARIVGQNDTTLAWALLPGVPHAPASPLVQWLQPGLALLSHAPCDLGCAASVALGGRILQAVERAEPGFAARWRPLAGRLQVVDQRGNRLALAVDGRLEDGARVAAADVLAAGGPDPEVATRARRLAGRVLRARFGGVVVDGDDWHAPYAADHRGAP